MDNPSTTNLLNTMLNTDADQINDYVNTIDNNRRPCDVFQDYFARTKLTPAVAVHSLKGLMSKSYIYGIFSGDKTNPSRDSLILLCLSLNMNYKETRQVLESYKIAPLYPKDTRDAIIGICINNKIYNVSMINEKLYDANVEILGNLDKN